MTTPESKFLKKDNGDFTAEDNKIEMAADPENPQDVVNLRTLKAVLNDLACLQIRRTTDYEFTNSWVDITFDTTDIENKSSIIEHDNTNTDRVLIKEDGIYKITYTSPIEYLDNAKFKSRVCKNDATELIGSLVSVQDDNDTDALSQVFIAELISGDFLTFQLGFTNGTPGEANAKSDIILTIVKLDAVKGDTGPTGPSGGPTGPTGPTGATGPSGGDTAKAVQIRRTTIYTLTTSYVDLDFDVTDVESDDTALEHSDVNTERINIKEDGTYMIAYGIDIDASTSNWDTTYAHGQVKKNGSTVLPGSHSRVTTFDDDSIDGSPEVHAHLDNHIIANLSNGDYITLQLKYVNHVANTGIDGTLIIHKL